MTEQTSAISRRTIAKGAAWAVPVVTLTTAPLVAATNVVPPPCLSAAFTGTPCRISNQGIYRFGFCITNNCTEGTFTFSIDRLENGSGKILTGTPSPGFPTGTITLAPGEQYCVTERDWTGGSQANNVDIFGTFGSSTTVTGLWHLPAPQKVDACA
jgi:hypothetical protein